MNATLSIVDYFLGHGDRALVLSQRLIECLTHAPEIEEEVAMANIALDLLGQTRTLYSRAAVLTGSDCTEDDFAYWREDRAFLHPAVGGATQRRLRSGDGPPAAPRRVGA